MKKLIFTQLLVCLAAFLFGQSQRLVLNEEFTQVYCGGCIQQNPKFDSLLKANSSKIISIKYQVYWPGVDFMHDDNPAQIDNRTNYYNPGYAPKYYLNGKCEPGNYAQPYYITQQDIDSAYAVPSPFDMKLTSYITPNGDSIYVKARIKATQAVSGDLRAMIVITEDHIWPDINLVVHDTIRNYYEIMKKMLPTEQGTVLPGSFAIGDTAVVNVTWKLAKIYDYPELAVVGFVQDYSSKLIHQAGYCKPYVPFRMVLNSADIPDRLVKFAKQNEDVTFQAGFSTLRNTPATYRFKLDKSGLPAGSSASMVISSVTYGDSVDLLLSAFDNRDVTIKINPGANSDKKAVIRLVVYNLHSMQAYRKTRSFYVYPDVTTLVINRAYVLNDLSSVTAAMTTLSRPYVQMGKDFYDNIEIRMIDTSTINKERLKHIIINGAGFSSGDLVPDRLLNELSKYLSSGGSIFITGSRIGSSAQITGYSTQMYKDFIKNTLGATWISCTNRTGSPLNMVTADPYFGNLAPGTLKSGSCYGEVINPNGTNAAGIVSFTNPSDICAIRNENTAAGWKTVYLGVTYNDISTLPFKNNFLDRVIDWFDNKLVSIDPGDNCKTLGAGYPNPAANFAIFPLLNLQEDAVLSVYNMEGKMVSSIKVSAGSDLIILELGNFKNGIYSCRLSVGDKIYSTRKMVVIR